MKKSVIAILTGTMILLSFLGPALYTREVRAVDPSPFPYDWYTTVNGVLDSDYYALYPFEKGSVNFGFSKYGELIGIPKNADPNNPANWVGMEYGSRDPFCPPTVINMTSWINGWYIDIEYIDPRATTKDRHLFAYAMFADGGDWGGNWQFALKPDSTPNGGRKTNGSCTTEPLKILYNGPRRFVAMSVTHIKDKEGTTTWDVLDVKITMIFDKVKKQVILLKDVKITIQKVHLYDKIDVQFSNREEYDLGPPDSYDSFAHFYEECGETCYGPEWHLAKNLTRHTVEHQVGDGSTTVFTLKKTPVAKGFIKVYVNGVFKYPGISPAPYTVDWNAGTVTFLVAPPSGADIEFRYKYVFKDDEDNEIPDWAHKYDIAQVISSDQLYVAWTAMWPPVSDYTVDGLLNFLYPLIEVQEDDMSVEPKQSPLIIGEWDFLLDHSYMPIFRCVEVKGICDWHNADDVDADLPYYWDGVDNVIDIEAYYQLDEVFMPWDLESAVHKDTERWVEFYEVTTEDVGYADLGIPLLIPLPHTPILIAETWEEYCAFAERVIWDGILRKPLRSIYSSYDYELYNGYYGYDGWGYIWIPASKVPEEGTEIKILYSTYTEYENWDSIDTDWTDEIPWDTEVTVAKDYNYPIIDPLGATHTLDIRALNFTISNLTDLTEDHEFVLSGTMDFYEEDFKVFKEGITTIDAYWWDQSGPSGGRNFRHKEDDGTIEVDFWYFWMQWWITPPPGEDLHVDWLHLDVDYDFTVFYNATTGNYTITTEISVNGVGGYGLPTAKYPLGQTRYTNQLYVEHVPGRYEWIVVGRDSHPVDSVGIGLVSAAFKNKQIEIGNGAMDMRYMESGIQSVPSVMRKFGTGNTWKDYYKLNDLTKPGNRTALADDWCTYWPVASSNLISAGGPFANMLTYYANDFTDAFYGIPWYTPYGGWSGAVAALTCWNKRGYWSNATIGYAAISTYKDINGTVIFVVWGVWGRDTFYACQWLHGDEARGIRPGIQQLQDAPPCLTTIILKMDFTEAKHPEFSIVECLGTITERLWIHHDELKGGIHDP